jgi:hypothetical protein
MFISSIDPLPRACLHTTAGLPVELFDLDGIFLNFNLLLASQNGLGHLELTTCPILSLDIKSPRDPSNAKRS